MAQMRFRAVGPKLNGAIVAYSKLAVGAINDRGWICNEAQDIIFNGHFCLQYGQDLSHQGGRVLLLDRIGLDSFETIFDTHWSDTGRHSRTS